MGRPRTPAETKRLHTFIGVAAVLWLGAAIAAVIDGDPLMALSWGSLAAFGGLRGPWPMRVWLCSNSAHVRKVRPAPSSKLRHLSFGALRRGPSLSPEVVCVSRVRDID